MSDIEREDEGLGEDPDHDELDRIVEGEEPDDGEDV